MNTAYKLTARNEMAQVDHRLIQEVEQGRTPSVQYVHFSADSVLHELRKGYADLRQNVPVSRLTTFPVLSVSKTVTALSILQLAQAKKVDLDQPVSAYLPWMYNTGEITARHLLTHSSGLKDPFPLRWIHPLAMHGTFDRNSFFRDILRARLSARRPAGKQYRYSNLGYVLLGQVLEAVTDMSYENYVQQHVIEVLGLSPDDLGFNIPTIDLHTTGYQNQYSLMGLLLGFFIDTGQLMDTRIGKWRPFRTYYLNGAPYGGLIGKLPALVRYGQALLRLDLTLLSADYYRLLFTENKTEVRKRTGIGMAWFTGHLNGNPYVAHAGGGGGYYCELRLYPDRQLGSFIVFNRTGFSDERYLDKVDRFMV